MKKIIGNLSVTDNITVKGNTVIKSNGINIPDENGNLELSTLVQYEGNTGDIILFDDINYKTQPMVQSARIVNTVTEIEPEKAFSTIGKIYDLLNNVTLEYNGTTWVSTVGITELKLGVLYSNLRTTKMFYVNQLDDIVLISGQTVGNQFAEIPSMEFFDSILSDNGYQILPSGLILQWGLVETVGSAGILTLQKPFTLMLGAFAIDTKPENWGASSINHPEIDYSNTTLTQIAVKNKTISGTTSVSVQQVGDTTVSVLAWGF